MLTSSRCRDRFSRTETAFTAAASLTGNGGFTFSNRAASGATYKVTILSQPVNPSQVCTLMNGVGTVGTVNVVSVSVSCTTNFYNVGGSVTGLVGSGLVLQINGSNNVSVATPGNYIFSTLTSFTPTAVQVDPSGQFASVANGDDSTVSIFRINLATGALTQVGAKLSTVTFAGGPSSIAIE